MTVDADIDSAVLGRRISVFDTTLRDGEQAPGNSMGPDAKLRVALAMRELGVDYIETGFPASSKSEFESTRVLAREITDTKLVTFSRANRNDVARAVEAAGVDNHQTQIMATGSDMHLVHKRGITRQDAVAELVDAISFARSLGIDDISVPIEDASRGEPDFLRALIESAIEAGATTFVPGDTSGCLLPNEYGALIRRMRAWAPSPIKIATHCHEDLGLSTANALAGLLAGADEVQATLGGIGERAGNTPLEAIIAILTHKPALGMTTGVRSEHMHVAYSALREEIGLDEPRNLSVLGQYAFSTAAGVHQQGMLNNPATYEFVEPHRFGRERAIVVSRHSGKVVLRHLLATLGRTDVGPEDFTALYERLIASRTDGCESIEGLRTRLEAELSAGVERVEPRSRAGAAVSS